MGKSSKSIIQGYWYKLGMHIGLMAGPVDQVRKIVVGGKLAWSGSITGNTSFRINNRNLFGGEKKEGGLDVAVDVCMGGADQGQNAYLKSQLGDHLPAFRGRLALVVVGWIGAMNYYVKPWSVQVSKFTAGWRTPVWRADLCQIDQGMNPAHIAYRVVTDPVTGQGRDPADALDLDRLAIAAQQLKGEGLGVCLRWTKSDATGNFIGTLCDHAGAVWADDPSTGKQYMKLLRGDYDPALLPILDESNIVALTSFEQPLLTKDTVNQMTVTYRNPETNQDVTLTVKNAANVQAQGGVVVNQSVEYKGAWNGDIAARLAMRDLRAASALPAKLKLSLQSPTMAVVNGVLQEIEIRKGEVYAFSWAKLNLAGMPIRVLDIDRGTAADGKLTLTCAQDVYALPSQTYVVDQPSQWVEPDLTPKAAPAQMLFEASYRDLAANLRAADLQQVQPDDGYVGALGAKPTSVSYGYALHTRTGAADFTERTSGWFAPTALLATAMSAEPGPTVVTVTSGRDLDSAQVGMEVAIGTELCRLDAINVAAGTMTLARGCVDTLPAAHGIGARLWVSDGFTVSDPTEWVAGETVDGKLITRSGDGDLDPSLAPISSVTMNRRQIRPYAPGNVTMNGGSPWGTPALTGHITLAWSHRARVLQADQLVDHTQGSVGPDAGTTYTMRIYDAGNVLLQTLSGITGTTASYVPSAEGTYRVELEASQGGYVSWQRYSFPLTITALDVVNPPWANVFSLLHFNGTNGSTTITDQVATSTWSASGGAQLSSAWAQFGATSLSLGGSGYVASTLAASAWKPFTDGVAAWTIEGFFRPTTSGSTVCIFDCGGIGTDTIGIGLDVMANGKLDFVWAKGTSGTYCARITGGSVSVNASHYFKVSFDPARGAGTKLQLYMDNVLIGQVDPSAPSSSNPSSAISIGRYVVGNSLFFTGYIDELRFTQGVALPGSTIPSTPFPDS
ncbi:hypothetical protein [Dyella sp. 2RAB6]|uniref:hypothetical protein n=1 Tax=Dyella sp. 2RAB6 TaxID=3232992 RepID=UPI003F8FAD1A